MLTLLATLAQAETNQERVRRWFRGAPPAVAPLPPQAPQRKAPAASEAPPKAAAIDPPKPAPAASPASRKTSKKQASTTRAKSASKGAAKPQPTGTSVVSTAAAPEQPISCGEARFGAGMPCGVIVANEWRYEAYSNRQKCQVRACLSAAQIKYIKSCFPEKKADPRC
jgi:hypothetical protein